MKATANKTEAKNRGRTPFFAARNSDGFIQAKLDTGQPNDKYETEADHMADLVVNQNQAGNQRFFPKVNSSEQRKPVPGIRGETSMPQLMRKREEEDIMPSGSENIQKREPEDEDLKVQNKAYGQVMADPSIEEKLKNNRGKGQKIDASTRAEMKNGFGADFSSVNIHTGQEAVQMSRALGAQAFTHGNDIYFNTGKYNPDSRDGKHLLAHELTHTIQQSGMIPSNLQFTIGDGHDLMADRFFGDPVLEACLDNEQILQQGSSGDAVTLIQQALIDAGFLLPEFGVDGIFGRETRTALQDFQRASGLVADGKVGPATMSALDALFAVGDPILPPAIPVTPAPVTPPTVTTQTVNIAPDGSPDSRTSVGVGERVRLESNSAGTWTTTEGHFIGLNNGASIVWEAPAVAGTSSVTVTTPGGSTATSFTVVAPDSLSMTVARNDAIPAGTAGACMVTDVTVNPLSVNFGRTQWLEVPGPATNVSGYFTRFAAATIFHHPNPNYLPFDDFNSGLSDHASWHEVPPPFSFGTFDWVVPNRYKIDGESDARGRFFSNTVQSFIMLPDGTMMILKAGASVLRTTTNVII